MHRTRVLILLVLTSLAAAEGTASGTIHTPGTFGTSSWGTSLPGSERTPHTLEVWNAAMTARETMTCSTVSYGAETPPAAPFTSLPVLTTFANCSIVVGGVTRGVMPLGDCRWRYSASTYNDVTGAATTVGLETCQQTFWIPKLSCSIVLTARTYLTANGSLQLQDRNLADTTSVTHTTANGMRFLFSTYGLDYTETCGALSGGTALYYGIAFAPSVWVKP